MLPKHVMFAGHLAELFQRPLGLRTFPSEEVAAHAY